MVRLRLAVHNTALNQPERAAIDRRVRRLERLFGRMTDCRVTIDVPQRRRRTDRTRYHVRLALSVPLGAIAIDRQPRETLRTALDDAFRAARRRLRDYADRLGAPV